MSRQLFPVASATNGYVGSPVMDVTTAAARSRAASLWSRRAVDLCRVATCLCRMP
ncbi:MAG: hypothetical protein QOJ03_1550 [Frankiaceae bacterium]|jgi:hypothetical protein|nr:hypothetical protein [Frankiaceae bacterium]